MPPLDTFPQWRAVLHLALTRRLQRLSAWFLMPLLWVLLGRVAYLLLARPDACPPFIRTWIFLVLAPLVALTMVMTFWPRHLRYHWGARGLLFFTVAVVLVPPMVRFWPLFRDRMIRVLPFLLIGGPLAWWAHRRSPEVTLGCRSVADEDRLFTAVEARLADLREGRAPALDLGVRAWGSQAWRAWKVFLGPDYLLMAAADGASWAVVEKAKARIDRPKSAGGMWVEGLRLRFPGQGVPTSLRAPLQGNPVVGRLSAEDLASFQAWKDTPPGVS